MCSFQQEDSKYSLEIKIFQHEVAVVDNGFDNKRRYFENEEIITINQIDRRSNGNGILRFKHDDNLEIWYSQLHRELWDKHGAIMPCILKINGKEYNVCELPIREFEELVLHKPLKVKYQERCYYYMGKYDEEEQLRILTCFRNREFKKIAKRYKARNLYRFEAVSE
ncbi:hypothetical protein [Gabonibacter chumensis]|uniref:hypothetical protein n=1 Tax=Gabonibacter chumensis TaxID=2972474 RepID=UPI0025727D6E|nr:hypothetical protein [Gabonibacter chumensis]MCR9010836.1 hypothetical protein [Gabonibacter chumensis]